MTLAVARDLTPPRFEAAVKAGAKMRSKLNAAPPAEKALWFAAIEAERARCRVRFSELAREASIADNTYRRLRADPGRATGRTLVLLFNALKRLRARSPAPRAPAGIIYGGFLAAACIVVRADIALAQTLDPATHARGAAADDPTRRAALARRIAIYLAVTEAECRQADVARAANLTPAAVCLALQAIEDERDNEAVDGMIDTIARLVTGEP